jgi:hypothetical protein
VQLHNLCHQPPFFLFLFSARFIGALFFLICTNNNKVVFHHKLDTYTIQHGLYLKFELIRHKQVQEVHLIFILNSCASLKELQLANTRFKYSLVGQVLSNFLDNIVIDNNTWLPNPAFLEELSTTTLPSLKYLEVEFEGDYWQIDRFPAIGQNTLKCNDNVYWFNMPNTSFEQKLSLLYV